MSADRRMHYFALLTREEQAEAIIRMAAQEVSKNDDFRCHQIIHRADQDRAGRTAASAQKRERREPGHR